MIKNQIIEFDLNCSAIDCVPVGSLFAYFISRFIVEGPTGAEPISSTALDKHIFKTSHGIPTEIESTKDSKKSMCRETRGAMIFLPPEEEVEDDVGDAASNKVNAC